MLSLNLGVIVVEYGISILSCQQRNSFDEYCQIMQLFFALVIKFFAFNSFSALNLTRDLCLL